MNMVLLDSICGKENFTVWNHEIHTFGNCFVSLCLTIPSQACLAVLSTYHFSRHYTRRIRGELPQSYILNLRFFIALFIGILQLILLVICISTAKLEVNAVSIVSWLITGIANLLHSAFIWRLKFYYHLHIRGPITVVLSFLLTTIAICCHVYITIASVSNNAINLNLINEIAVYITISLHVLYIATLFSSKRPLLQPSSLEGFNNRNVNDTNSEREPLLQSQDRIVEDTDLGVAESHQSWLSHAFFIWANPLMQKGYCHNISKSADLFDLPEKLDTKQLAFKFQNALFHSRKRKQGKNSLVKNNFEENGISNVRTENNTTFDNDMVDRKENNITSETSTSVICALNKAFGRECWSLGILQLITDGSNLTGPILLNLLVSYTENSEETTWHGYLYATALFCTTFICCMSRTHFMYRIQILGLKVRAALISSVYKKALNVSTVSLSKFTTGDIVNFMSTDTDRVVNFSVSFHSFWSLPISVVVSLYLLYSQVGLAFLTGLGFALMLGPLNRYIALVIGRINKEMMAQKDARVKVMNEILHGIRVIKFYAWEQHFTKKIGTLRHAELQSLKKRKYISAFCVFFWATTTTLISILTFTTYALLGHQLTATKVFTCIAVFNILMIPLNAFPWALNGLMEAWVSVKRIEKYMQLPEIDLGRYYSMQTKGIHKVNIDNATFTWDFNRSSDELLENEKTHVNVGGEDNDIKTSLLLEDIFTSVNTGSLVGIIGKVGSGKSSLLNAILAEMHRKKGTILVNCIQDGFGYAAQEAWIQHATLKENILSGKPYVMEKYENVIDACALREDLKILPGGDMTEIGENGVTLSGGQKARVALARAVYQDKEVYLLDDPFAAVDAHVASDLYSNCVQGLLKDKTVILCTHHTKFLRHADHVIVLENGKIIRQGSPDDVLNSAYNFTDVKAKNEEKNDGGNEKEEDNLEQVGLVEEEEQETGEVRFEVYWSYFVAVGKCLTPTILLSLMCMQACRNGCDLWLSYWVTHSHTGGKRNVTENNFISNSSIWRNLTYGDDNDAFYLSIYGGIAVGTMVFAFIRAFLFAYGGVCAATTIHEQLLGSILKAPIKFFDTTPIGRILNRFSTDVYAIDDQLTNMINPFISQSTRLTGALFVTCYGMPWFIVVLIPLAITHYFIQKYYRHTSREVKRISSVTLSPIYANFSETVTGLTTIRAIREQKRFEDLNRVKLEENQRAQFAVFVASTWLGIRLQMISIIMVTAVAFIAVLEHHFRTVNPGMVGLALSYILGVTYQVSGVVQWFTEAEKQMVSVERAQQYIKEVTHETQDSLITTPFQWPSRGEVKFKNIRLQYRDGLPFALDGVSFSVKQREKIGIVGRTGSGKSSLFLTLFRMVNINSGEIEIDGINIGHIQLADLRSKMAIIPQDPFLFSGTVRENLDPEGKNSDLILQQVIDRCYLTDVVERLGGLDAEVHERGRDFSVGQRQLMCLARALLTRAKILCIDEATASVDRDTDEKVQLTIQSEFSDNTVLTIAHRISTVQHSDRVLVMNAAKVHEFDTPENLMNDQQSMFYSLMNSHR